MLNPASRPFLPCINHDAAPCAGNNAAALENGVGQKGENGVEIEYVADAMVDEQDPNYSEWMKIFEHFQKGKNTDDPAEVEEAAVTETAKEDEGEKKAEKKAAAKLVKEAQNEERTDIIRTICENLAQSSNISVEVTP